MGAPWKQSPESTQTTFGVRFRSRLSSVAKRVRPPICTRSDVDFRMGESGAYRSIRRVSVAAIWKS